MMEIQPATRDAIDQLLVVDDHLGRRDQLHRDPCDYLLKPLGEAVAND